MKTARSPSSSPDFEFENVDISAPAATEVRTATPPKSPSPLYQDGDDPDEIIPATGVAHNTIRPAEDEDEDQADRDYYSDLSDEELLDQLATEAEEHARFASQLHHQPSTTTNTTTTRQSAADFDAELKNLRSQQKKDRRDADEVTQQMITECQQLLSHFGLPYVTAPMEAEAQCAELVRLRLVDGIVTDDSDIFLFGGTRVYKNMFNAAKFVECYLASDLEREFDLTREKMIGIAHLLGSDYTEGLPGVGPVTALEILSEFPSGLAEFHTWWARVQTGAKPTDEDNASAFRRKFRRKSAKLFLPAVFPDTRVDMAYLQPEVDSDPSAFVWGVPDLDSLRSYLMATIGWTQERTDEVLVPVIKDMNRREKEGTQSNITQFLGGSVGVGAARGGRSAGAGAGAGSVENAGFAPRRKDAGKSRRMEVALERLAEKARERRRVLATAKRQGGAAAADATTDGDDSAMQEDAVVAIPGSAAKGTAASDANVVSMTAASLTVPSTGKKSRKPADKNGKSKSAGRKRKAAAPVDDDDDDDDEEDDAEVDDAGEDLGDDDHDIAALAARKPRATKKPKRATARTKRRAKPADVVHED